MKNTVKTAVSLIGTAVFALIACMNDSSQVVYTIFMIASVICGAAFVLFVNKETGSDQIEWKEAHNKKTLQKAGRAA